MADLVSVIIPAFNAQLTLSETISSVQAQTHGNLEIIVVDDGSTDQTLSMAKAHAAQDSRIQVISTVNGGVASARNAGIAASRGAFVAPIDADDLWHPNKIERQLAIMKAGGSELGFVFTLFRRIDQNSQILWSCSDVQFQGRVFLQMLMHNFVGNGSSLLIRRDAIKAVGGYEPDLRQRNAQGCEDYLLQLLIARHWLVGLVPEYLTGYRVLRWSMSADMDQMTRSHIAMLDHVRRRYPETPAADLAASEAAVRARNGVARIRRFRLVAGASQLWRALQLDPRTTEEVAAAVGRYILRRIAWKIARLLSSPSGPKQFFLDADPTIRPRFQQRRSIERRLARLTERDRLFCKRRRCTNSTAPPPRTGCLGGLQQSD